MKNLLILCVLISIPCFDLIAQVNITAGTQVRIMGTTQIVIQDLDLIQNGSLTPEQSTVIFSGSNSSSILGSSIELYNLTVNKTGANLIIGDSTNVSNNVTFTLGNIDLAGKSLNLLSTGSLQNESENARAFSSSNGGRILREYEFIGAVNSVDAGNLGLTLSTGGVMGLTQIIRSHDAQTFPGGDGIDRYYEVIPNNNSGLNATVRFEYFDGELNSLPEGDLLLYISQDNGSTWTSLGASNSNTNTNFLEQSGINEFGRITAATQATFPVEWLDFTAEPFKNRFSLLTWVTGSEQNNQGFLIERGLENSPNQWETIGFVEGEGNSTTPTIYEFVDQSPSSGENFYRIKQVDFNGTFDYSQIRSVFFEASFAANLYPNPANISTYIDFELADDQRVKVLLFDGAGKLIRSNEYELFAGKNKIEIPVSELADGIYYIRLEGKGLSTNLKLQVD
ncbi:MAG: T9SS type A sorting domain-containing protein [Bacteroidia bacterium]|nr:T9SS type A sorting domain-containing protein [Bacteroidia bacterium]